MIKTLISCFFVFFYLYSVQFVFVPGHIGTRALLGIFGFFFLIANLLSHKVDKIIRSRIKMFFCSLIPIVIMSFITMLINGTKDAEFVKYFFSMTLILCGAYLIYRILKKLGLYNLYNICFRHYN